LKKKTRNKFETKIYTQLRRAKVDFKYEEERIAYILARHYLPDFIISTPLGKIYIECKGYLRQEDKAKLAAVKRQHPDKDLRIVFYEKRIKQIKWAERQGIRYAIGKIPIEWIQGL